MKTRIEDMTPALLFRRESISLGPDEELGEFVDALIEALGEYIEHDGPWGAEAIGDGWVVVQFVTYGERKTTRERFKITWTQTDEGFEFGTSEKVQRRVVYPPAGEGCKRHGKRRSATEPDKSTESIQLTGSDWTFAEESGVGTRFEFKGLRETHLLEDVAVFREGPEMAEAAPFEVKPEDFTSPAGATFAGILVGFMAVDSVVNLNRRLYDPEGEEGLDGMRQNVERMQGLVSEAFANGTGGIPGELDHADGPPTFQGLATEIIDLKRDGVRVAVKMGVIDTVHGQTLLKAAEHGFPIGQSTVAYGAGERRVMDKENPFFALNADKEGMVYEHIYGFVLEQSDTVRHPSAQVFVKAQRESVDRDVREAFDKMICADGTCPIDGQCADGSEPKHESETDHCIKPDRNNQPSNEENGNMDETQIKEMLAKLGLGEATIAELGSKIDGLVETVSKQAEAITSLETKLGEKDKELSEAKTALEDTQKVIDAQKETLAVISAERDEKAMGLIVKSAIDKVCEGKTFGAKRSKFLSEGANQFVAPTGEDADPEKAAAEFFEARNTWFEENLVPAFAPEKGENARPVSESHHEVQNEKSQFHGDVVPFALSHKAKATEGAAS